MSPQEHAEPAAYGAVNYDPWGKPRVGDWVQTRTGVKLHLLDTKPEDFRAEDIAHALSNMCRFTGHTKKFYCPTPDQRILTSDLRWVPAGDLSVGEELLAFDESPFEPGSAGKNKRRLRHAVVTHAVPVKRKVVRLEMADGSTVTASEEHPWLVATKMSRNQKWLSSGKIAEDLADGRTRYMHKIIETWKPRRDWTAGWLSGMADGEGHVSIAGRTGSQAGISQKPGATLDRLMAGMLDGGFRFKKTPAGNNGVFCLQLLDGWRGIAKFLGVIRPERLVGKFSEAVRSGVMSKELNNQGGPIEIIAAYDEGEQWVAGLETSTHTYICEGYGAHNSVAEHSVRVCRRVMETHPHSFCPPRYDYSRTGIFPDGEIFQNHGGFNGRELAFSALMHDASEAYLADIARPFKHLPEFDWYRKIEDKLMHEIADAFNFSYPLHPAIKNADEVLLGTEARDLMAPVIDGWHFRYDHLPERIRPWSPRKAKREFLSLFYQLNRTGIKKPRRTFFGFTIFGGINDKAA